MVPTTIVYPSVDQDLEANPAFYQFDCLLEPVVSWKRNLQSFALDSQEVDKQDILYIPENASITYKFRSLIESLLKAYKNRMYKYAKVVNGKPSTASLDWFEELLKTQSYYF